MSVLTGEALVAAEAAYLQGRLFWRASGPGGEAANGGKGAVGPCGPGTPGPWSQCVPNPVICESGWHATTDPVRWAGVRVALVEVDEVIDKQGDKVVCRQLRELGVVEATDPAIDVRVWVAVNRANLAGANLAGADLRWACLARANLAGANLARANLYEATLYGANLYGANLSGANLAGANLARANLSGTNLYEAFGVGL